MTRHIKRNEPSSEWHRQSHVRGDGWTSCGANLDPNAEGAFLSDPTGLAPYHEDARHCFMCFPGVVIDGILRGRAA